MPRNYISNKDETVRMFDNNFLEALSRVHPSVPVIIYGPIILYFVYLSVVYDLKLYSIILMLLVGIVVWSIIEYSLHRFIFHYNAKSEFGKKLHFMFHGVHHDYPSDSRRLVMPPSVSIPLAVIFYFAFMNMIGYRFGAPFFAGFLTGYLFYDLTHYAIHHFNMHNRFWLYIKNHHMKHHYMDSSKGFGVSSPTWDKVIGTDFPKTKEKEAI
ncbi:MAG TPA: sterol desaturase family protein [Ignavibacteriaceae bacterium]|nr:sterol desaturase family protein [Ignavibacteriaceae bacterium]